MPQVVSVIGKSESGKTTVIEKLITELRGKGYRIATIKHTPQDIAFDQPHKDSWRHIQAGSSATAVSASDKVVLIKMVDQELKLDELIRFFGEDYDLILAEGFKQGDAPKIEVHRKEIGPPLTNVKRLIAIVTDETLETKARQFSFDEVKDLADLLEQGFVKPHQERISLYVNSKPVPLSAFPREIIGNTLLAIVSALKGVGEIRSLDISLRRKS